MKKQEELYLDTTYCPYTNRDRRDPLIVKPYRKVDAGHKCLIVEGSKNYFGFNSMEIWRHKEARHMLRIRYFKMDGKIVIICV